MTSLSRTTVGTRVAERGRAWQSRPACGTRHVAVSATHCVRSRGSKPSLRKGTHSVVTCHTEQRQPPGRAVSLLGAHDQRARLAPDGAAFVSRTPCARLLLAWRPWSSPFGKAAPSLGTNLLGHERERHEENVWCVGRDVSPYGCDDVISCLSACPSHQRHSPDPYSARAL